MGNKTSTNLTLHKRIRELADKLQSSLGYGSLSTLVEGLIREEYERRNGPMQLDDASPKDNPTDPVKLAHDTFSQIADNVTDYGAKKLRGQGNPHRRRKAETKPSP
jgi:hypothetical protein